MHTPPGYPVTANRNTLWAAVFVGELALGGVRHAVIAPGSRSTPLVLALDAHEGIACHTVLDERSAGFFALGLARASGRPVAVVCTSGSAAANFLPAVVEAHLSRVPLLVLTTDRPPLLRDTGAGQTIDQIKLYGDAVRWFFEVGEPVMAPEDVRHLRQLAGQALGAARRAPAGPVHLNFAFRKPLEPTPVPGDVPEAVAAEASAAAAAPRERAWARADTEPPPPPPRAVQRVADAIRAAPRGLILCGPMTHAPLAEGANGAGDPRAAEDAWPAALTHLARCAGYPVLAEPPAGVLSGPHDPSHLVAASEAMLRSEAFRARLRPALILRFGGQPTPRHVEVLQEEHPHCPVVVVNEAGVWLEPTQHPAEVVAADPAAFCSAVAEALGGHANAAPQWLAAWQEAEGLAREAITASYSTPPPAGLGDALFEGRVFSELAALLPDGAVQCTASSMPVRDLAYFTPPVPTRVRHLVSRGANGIDGTLSTALGAAAWAREAGAGPAVLVTGDLAFLHDSNGLIAARQYGLPLLVVLLNNDGGGIFEMLPIAEYGAAYERHFGTPHGTDFAALCAAHGIPLERVADWAAFRAAVQAGLAAGGPRVVEVRTDRRENRAQHGRVWAAVAERLAAAFPPEREI